MNSRSLKKTTASYYYANEREKQKRRSRFLFALVYRERDVTITPSDS